MFYNSKQAVFILLNLTLEDSFTFFSLPSLLLSLPSVPFIETDRLPFPSP